MDTLTPFPEDELKELEQRLSSWTPSVVALGRDRMLFEAGRASARSEIRYRLTTALAACVTALAVGLGGWAVREHAQRRALELALAERSRAVPVALAEPWHVAPSVPNSTTAPESYLALSRRLSTVGLDEPGAQTVLPIRDQRSASPVRSLTPLSALRPGGLMDL